MIEFSACDMLPTEVEISKEMPPLSTSKDLENQQDCDGSSPKPPSHISALHHLTITLSIVSLFLVLQCQELVEAGTFHSPGSTSNHLKTRLTPVWRGIIIAVGFRNYLMLLNL